MARSFAALLAQVPEFGRALGALDDGQRFEPVPGSRWAVVEGIERPALGAVLGGRRFAGMGSTMARVTSGR